MITVAGGHTVMVDADDRAGIADAPSTSGQALLDRFALEILPLPDAEQQLIAIGQRYWDLKRIDDSSDPPHPLWQEKTSVLGRDVGIAGGRAYVFAAAGVRALVPAFNCPSCGQGVTLRSRQGLDRLLAGNAPELCVDCDAEFLTVVARETNPDAMKRHGAAQVASRQRGALAEARRNWQAAQKAYVSTHDAIRLNPDPNWLALATSVRTEAAALAIVRRAPAVTPIPPMNTWPVPLAPTIELTAALAGDCYRAGFIAIHPDSPVGAFVWAPTFEDAMAQIDGDDPSDPPNPKWHSFYPLSVNWYVPTGGSLGTAAEELDAHLVNRLGSPTLGRGRREDLLDLVVELIAEETLRYFTFQLNEHNLPDVPENHVSRLAEAARRLAAVRSLGETYNTAWTMVRAAAATAQARQYAPRANMTTHAVNLFEEKAQELSAKPEVYVKPFREDGRVPLSALTKTVFITLLDSDTMGTSRAGAETLLARRDAEVELQSDEDHGFTEMMRIVLGSEADGDPHAIYAALGRETTNDNPVIAAAATKLVDVVEDLRIATHSLATALGGAVSACRLLSARVEVPDLWWGGSDLVERPVGVFLAELMRRAAEPLVD